jgi:hypothetical protein
MLAKTQGLKVTLKSGTLASENIFVGVSIFNPERESRKRGKAIRRICPTGSLINISVGSCGPKAFQITLALDFCSSRGPDVRSRWERR